MAVPGEDEYFHITKQGRLITVTALQLPGRMMQRMPMPAWIRVEEDGFFFVCGPNRTSPGRLWEFQQVNDDQLVCLHVPTTPYRLVMHRVEWTEPPEWLAKLFAHSSEWMDRHEKSA
ncbi:MAG: hypothetical protein IAE77_00310 [Prosthecobacter sp.]|nr:hypothetical protein [Prosthecobacter sp.]